MNHDRFLELGGNSEIPLTFFKANVNQNKRLINYYTFDRIDVNNIEHTSRMEECIIELMHFDYTNTQQDLEIGNIKSETVGGHRVDYNVTSNLERESYRDAQRYEIIKKYFAHTGLMYRGASK